MVYNKNQKSPDSLHSQSVPALGDPSYTPGDSRPGGLAALPGGAAAARGPEILPDRPTFVEPRGAQADDASGEQGNEGGREGGKVSSLRVFFLGGAGWGWFF